MGRTSWKTPHSTRPTTTANSMAATATDNRVAVDGDTNDLLDGGTGSDDIYEGDAGDVFLNYEHITAFKVPTRSRSALTGAELVARLPRPFVLPLFTEAPRRGLLASLTVRSSGSASAYSWSRPRVSRRRSAASVAAARSSSAAATWSFWTSVSMRTTSVPSTVFRIRSRM